MTRVCDSFFIGYYSTKMFRFNPVLHIITRRLAEVRYTEIFLFHRVVWRAQRPWSDVLVYQCAAKGDISNSSSYFYKMRLKLWSLNSTTPYLVTMITNYLPKAKWILLINPRDKFFCKFVLLLKPSYKYRKLCSYFVTMVWLLGDKQPVSTSIYIAAKTSYLTFEI